MKAVYELTKVLGIYFNIHKSRLVLIAQVVLALIKVRIVCLNELASAALIIVWSNAIYAAFLKT
jgi:hypothetical protein